MPMIALAPHGIPRAEWENRFKAAIINLAGLGGAHADAMASAELESWPEQDEVPVPGFDADWVTEMPESAAMENLTYWTQ